MSTDIEAYEEAIKLQKKLAYEKLRREISLMHTNHVSNFVDSNWERAR